ncbi:upf0565 protein [Anaeramoeba ignava]|uniref:Upf0565 protein n=1 Tax=Anaeramoeba ignava TaxID=1746090 RepID=A0A9Q0LV13_ANAIG|nr:upf0565 protein [Anaeramoeba ignava]
MNQKEFFPVFSHLILNPKTTVIYFQGDIQNFQNEIERIYEEYSLEKTMKILKEKFPDSNILMPKPKLIKRFLLIIQNFFLKNQKHQIIAFNFLYNSLLFYCKSLKIDFPEQFIIIGFSRGSVVLERLFSISILIL